MKSFDMEEKGDKRSRKDVKRKDRRWRRIEIFISPSYNMQR